MAAPVLESFAQAIYDSLPNLQWAEEFTDYSFAKFCSAIGTMFQLVDDYGRDTPDGKPGWSIVLDVERCPVEALPWLGQFVGVRLPTRGKVVQYTNLVMDPGLETVGASAYFTVANGAAADGVAYKKSGARGVRFTANGAGNMLANIVAPNQVFVVDGEEYIFSGAIRPHQAKTFNVSIRWRDQSGNLISDTPANVYVNPTVDDWTTVSATGVVPVGVRYGSLLITELAPANGNYFDLDELAAIQGSALPATGWFDGDSANSRWTGAVNNSWSELLGIETDIQYADRIRSIIQDANNQKRGRPQTIINTAKALLTGEQIVILRERDTSPYHFSVITYVDETPDPVSVLSALTGQKPATLVMNYTPLTGQDYQNVKNHYATYTAVKAAYADYAHLKADLT